MGLVITVMFLPAVLAFALYFITKRDQQRTNFEIEKETIFSKHASAVNNTFLLPTPKLKNENEKENEIDKNAA